MKPLTRALCCIIPTIMILSIVSYLTVNNCTDEQLKWMPLIIVITMVLVIALAMVNAVLQDIKDESEETFQFGCDPDCADCENLINARLRSRKGR